MKKCINKIFSRKHLLVRLSHHLFKFLAVLSFIGMNHSFIANAQLKLPAIPTNTQLSNQFEYSAEYIYRVMLGTDYLEDGAILAYVNGQLRGAQTASVLFPPTGLIEYKVRVFSNTTSGDIITFRYYDILRGKIYEITEEEIFIDDNVPDYYNPTLLNAYCGPTGIAIGLLPQNMASDQNTTLDLFWQPSENTTHYSLYLWKEGDAVPASPYINTIYGTSTRLYNLTYGETYHWYIQSVNQCLQDNSITQSFTVRDLPDLIVTQVSAPDTVLSVTPFAIEYSIKNQNVGSTLGTLWYDAVYISKDNVFSTDDYFLGQIERKKALVADSSYTNSISVSLPSDYSGNYYLFVAADKKNNIPETDNENNKNTQARAIYVKEKPLPDVKVSGISSKTLIMEPGDTVEFSWDVENIGEAVATGGWTEKVSIISLSGIRLNLSGTPQYTGVLEKGETISRKYNFILPDIISFSGEAYIEVNLVPSNELIEYPGNEVNNKATSLNRIRLQSMLYLTIPNSVIENYTGLLRCYVSRSGDYTNALTVNLTTSVAGELNIPASVTIPARNSSVVFNITTIDNAILDGSRNISIEAGASGYTSQSQILNVLDDEVSTISLSFDKTTATEGDSLLLTISRDLSGPDSPPIYLSSNQTSQWTFPVSAVIEENKISTQIKILITNNTIPELNATVSISARAEGFISGSATATILDDDIPQIELNILTDTVSEGAGPYATWGVIRRKESGSSSIRVNLSSDTPNALFFPSSVTLDKDIMEKQFNIGVVDNGLVDGFRNIELSGAIFISSCNCNTSSTNGGVVKAALTIIDNDGPSLSLTVNPVSLKEGLTNAGTLSVFRNTATTQDLEVRLTSNDTSELTVPGTVTIPAGKATLQVPLNTKDDHIDDGNQMVTIQAKATGFSAGITWVYVTDINRPDLEMTDLELSNDTVVAGSQITVQATVSNKGYGTAPSGVKVKLYLSKDNKIDSNDSVIYESILPDPIPIGQSESYLELVTVPPITGNYYLLAKVNPDTKISELLYINNESASIPLTILPNYNGIAHLKDTIFTEPIPVPIHGQAILTNGNPAPNTKLDVYIITGGIRREIQVTTDKAGNFSTVFKPNSYESGHYIVGACYPNQKLNVEQDAFDILGMERSSKEYMIWNIKKDVPTQGKIGIKNKSSIPLTHLRFETLSVPDGFIFNIDSIATLPGNGISEFNYTLQGLEISESKNYIEVPIKISCEEGISLEFTAYYYCQSLESHLISEPASINTTMTKGKNRYYNLRIINNGAGETGKMSIELPDINWITLVSAETVANLPSGDTLNVTLLLSPQNDIPLNTPLRGSIVAHVTNGNDLQIPFRMEVVSEETGSLQVDVVDEYTYFTADAPHVKNAHVVVRHPFSGKIMAEGFTDYTGIYQVNSLPEGSYTMTIDVDKHEGYQNTVIIDPGRVNEQSVFLSFQAITYTWEVVATGIEDNYEVELVIQYETNVPAPVVVVEMPKVMPQLFNDQTYTFMVTMTNKGLITAEDVQLKFPEDDPEYEWVMNFTKTNLLAQQAIQIPVVMRIKNSLKSTSFSGQTSTVSPMENRSRPVMRNVSETDPPCTAYAFTIYGFECGEDRQWHNDVNPFTISGRICTGNSNTNITDGEFPIPDLWDYPTSISGPYQTPKYEPILFTLPSISSVDKGCDPCAISVLETLMGCVPGPWNVLACGAGFAHGITISAGVGCIPVVGCIWGIIGTVRTCYSSPPFGGGGPSKKSLSVQQNMSSNEAPPIINQATIELEYADYFFTAKKAYFTEFMGSMDWEAKESFPDFATVTDSIITNKISFDSSVINKVKQQMQGTDISDAEIDAFVYRWNMTMAAWNQGVFSPTVNFPDIIDKDSLNSYIARMDVAEKYAVDLGYSSVNEMEHTAYYTIKEEVESSRSSVCASVSIKISQKLVMTREAFEGTLTIFNGNTTTAMSEIKLDLEIRDENGVESNDLFQIDTKALDILTGIDGTGSLGANLKGSATVLFIPEKGAAPEVPMSYSFGGSFSYLDPFTGVTVTKPLFPVTLQVNPSPDLFLHYFMQRNILGDDALTEPIEPIVPAELAVMIVNNGYGIAKSVRIESAQPEIVDNEKGLSIHFALIGSNLNGQARQLGLTDIDFGNIAPKSSSVGQWWFTSDLLGHFVNYKASVTHLDSRGNPDLSLISGAKLHELIKSVRVYGATDDGINDFLINEFQDSKEQPDAIYMSQGDIVLDVFGASFGVFDGTIQSPGFTNTLNVTASKIGWNYIVLPDPGKGKYEIVSVTRNADLQEIPLDNAWLTYVTLPDGKEPIYEDKYHMVDIFEEGGEHNYTIVWKLKDPNPPSVVRIQGAPEAFVTQPVSSVTITFNKEINPATFSYQDMTLRLQGGADIMDSSVVITQVDAVTYTLNLSSLTTGDGFYALTVQAAEIEDMGGTKGLVGKQVSWTQFLGVPAVEEFIGLPDNHVGSSFDYLMVRFNLPIDMSTLLSSRFVLAKDGVPVGGQLTVTLMDTDARLFSISGLGSGMTTDGNYSLTVDLPNIATITGEKGLLQQSVEWAIDTTPPSLLSFTKITAGGFDEQHVTGMNINFSEDVTGFIAGSVELWKDSLQQPMSQVHNDSLGIGTYKLSQFRLLTYYPGIYTLKVNMNNISDKAGITGSGIIEYQWSVNRSIPSPVENLRITPDLGYSDTDGITSTHDFTAIMHVVDAGVRIELYKNNFGTLTLLADTSNVMAGDLYLPVNITASGNTILEVHCLNSNKLYSVTQLPIRIDGSALYVSWQKIPQKPVITHPTMVDLVFSDKILEPTLLIDDFSLWLNGGEIGLSNITIQKISDTLFSISGFNNINNLPGDYMLMFDVTKTHKYLSGMAGTYVASTHWTILDVNVSPVANAGEDFDIIPGNQYWLDASGSFDENNDQLTYQWFPPTGITLDNEFAMNSSFIAPADTGTKVFSFFLLVSDGSLTSTDKVSAFLPKVSGIEYPSEDYRILVYPNPCSEYFIVSISEVKVNSIHLIDFTGKILMNQNWAGENEQRIELNHIPGGIYFLKINTPDKIIMQKIIVL